MLCFPTLSWCLMTFIVHEVLLKCGHCSNMGNAKRWSWVALKLNSVLSIRLVCQDYMWWYMVWQDCTWRENTTDQTNICRKHLLYFTAYVHSLLVENFFFLIVREDCMFIGGPDCDTRPDHMKEGFLQLSLWFRGGLKFINNIKTQVHERKRSTKGPNKRVTVVGW